MPRKNIKRIFSRRKLKIKLKQKKKLKKWKRE